NTILAYTLALKKDFPDASVTLVSKDINLRIKASILGINAEDYYSDKTLEDADLLGTGSLELPADFWEKSPIESWQEGSRTFYRLRGPLVRDWYPSLFVYEAAEKGIEAIVRQKGTDETGDVAVLELTRDFRGERHSLWGVA